jgi:hypothetical protein
MAFRFPSFEKGTKGTLLDSAVAKTVKRFIEAWNNVRIVRGATKDELTVTDSNVVLSLSGSEGGGGSGYTEGTAVEVAQGSDGKLVKVVKHSTATSPANFPTILKVVAGSPTARTIAIDQNGIKYEDGFSAYIQINHNGLIVHGGSNNYVQITKDAVQVIFDAAGNGVSIVKNEGIHVYTSAGKDCYIANSAITRDMSVREIDVCDNGTAKKMLVLGSAPY